MCGAALTVLGYATRDVTMAVTLYGAYLLALADLFDGLQFAVPAAHSATIAHVLHS